MRKTIWDIPNYHGCNKWSDDGMLAVLTANSIQVFTPTFKHNSFYLARWMQLELMGENDGVPKKSKVYVAPKESFTASTAEDLIKWMSTVNSTDDRSFGKLDINSMYFKKMLWSPPGLGIFSSSILSALLSNGSVLLVVMVGSSHMNHKIFTNDRRFNVHMFSMSIALDLSSLFQEWLAQKGNGAGITDQTTKMDVDSDSDDDTEDEEHERGNGLKEFHGGACIINEIACYPHLLSYNGMQHGRTDCMIFATGSSLGHINLWAIQSTSGYLLEASCVCSVLLTESSLQSSSSSNSQYFQGNSQHHSHSVTCMEFLTTTDDCDRSYNGNFSTRLLCGTSEGFFVVFNINSASGNLLDGEMNSGDYVLRRGVGGLPLLKMGKPRHILRPFDSPVDSITVSSNACCNVYLRSGVKLVQTDSEFQHIFPVENIHSNVVTSISVINSREYSTKGPSGVGILLTSSLDGDVKLWAELPCRAYQYVDYGINDISCNNDSHNRNENEGEDQDNVTTTIPLDKEMKQNRDENCNLNFIELFNVNDKMNNNNLSYVDITSDPLQLIYAITHLIPSSIIDSREVQMNKNLERSHCGLYIFLSPILDLKWITIPGNVLQVFKSIIFSSSTSLLSSKNFDKNVMNDDPQVNSSYSNNYSGENSDNHNCHNINLTGHSQNNERRYDFTSYYHNYSEEYFDVKAISGLSFSWLKSLEEVVQHYVATSMNTAVGNLTINEKVELGIVDTNKRYREKCKDEDEENEEDGIASKTGISDVAHKVKNLLYPNIENLLSDSFEVAIVAANSIAVDLNAAMQRDRNHDTGDDSINNSYRNDSSSGRAGREEREGEGGVYIKESNSVFKFEGCESSFSTLLSLPIQGYLSEMQKISPFSRYPYYFFICICSFCFFFSTNVLSRIFQQYLVVHEHDLTIYCPS